MFLTGNGHNGFVAIDAVGHIISGYKTTLYKNLSEKIYIFKWS